MQSSLHGMIDKAHRYAEEPGRVRLAAGGDLRSRLGEDVFEGPLELRFRLGHFPSISDPHGRGPVMRSRSDIGATRAAGTRRGLTST